MIIPETISQRFTAHKSIELKEKERAIIAQQTADYLAKGKTIEQVPVIIHAPESINQTVANQAKIDSTIKKITTIVSDKDYIHVGEICALANVNRHTVSHWRTNNKFPRSDKVVGNAHYWKTERVQEFFNQLTEDK
jgi:predicted DNA-binding transcriptional regulator AlpA